MLQRLKEHWKHYLWQSILGSLAILALLLLLNSEQLVIISSFGATTFIVFMKPHNVFASSRNVIGGHMLGLLSGALFGLIPHTQPIVAAMIYAGAVGLSLLLMASSDLEHPPAAGTALSVAMDGFTWPVFLTVFLGTVILSLISRALRKWLIDL